MNKQLNVNVIQVGQPKSDVILMMRSIRQELSEQGHIMMDPDAKLRLWQGDGKIGSV